MAVLFLLLISCSKEEDNSLADGEDGEKNQKFKGRGNVVK